MGILDIISNTINIIAIIIMVWGTILTIIKTVIIEFKHFNNNTQILKREEVRIYLGSYILLGLEIFIVSDIIEIIIKPTLEDLTILIIIVFVRTIISFFLGKEMKEASDEIKEFSEKKGIEKDE